MSNRFSYFLRRWAPVVGAVTTVAVVPTAFYFGFKGQVATDKWEKLYGEARVLADTNQDGKTSVYEWEEAYKKMEIPFELFSPRLPSISDLERFIKSSEDNNL